MRNPFISRREHVRREAAGWFARLQGDASAGDRFAFERWRSASPDHQAAFERMEALYRDAGALAPSTRSRARTAAAAPAPARRDWRYAVAAALVLLLAVPPLVVTGGFPSSPAGAQTQRFATRIGEVRTIALSDGSRVTLDASSRLDVALEDDGRRLTLKQGRVRVRSNGEDARPFQLDAGPGRITSLGGTFDVSLHKAEVHVVPIEGTLEVQAMLPTSPGSARVLPGQEAMMTGQGLRIGHPTGGTSWPDGVLVFREAELSQAIDEANRYGGPPIRLSEPSLGRLRVSGRFGAGDTAALARTLAAALNLRVVEDRGALSLHPTDNVEAQKEGG